MSTQFLRKASLIVIPNTDAPGLDLSELHFKFITQQQDLQSPNNVTIRVYNLSRPTMSKIEKEFTGVIVQAGYQDGNYGVVFQGNIKYLRRGKENATDTYLDIIAADGDQAYNFAYLNTTLAAGSTPADHVNSALTSLKPFNITNGGITGLDNLPKLPRGKVLYGPTKNFLREAAVNSKTAWSFQNGQLQVLPTEGYLDDEAVVVSAATGMIGIPSQTINGILVKMLLNPRLKVGGRIQIDNDSINRFNLGVSLNDQLNYGWVPVLDDDGFYRILVVEHSGDTRGNEWYSDVVCVALDASAPPSLVQSGKA